MNSQWFIITNLGFFFIIIIICAELDECILFVFNDRSTQCIYIRLKIKLSSVRIRFLSCQNVVLPSTGFELTPLIHCNTNRLALCPAPQTTRPHSLHKKCSFNSRSVTLSRKANLEIAIIHVFKRVYMVHIYLYIYYTILCNRCKFLNDE